MDREIYCLWKVRTCGLTLKVREVRKLKKKNKKFEITNSHWREIWRAFGLKWFRSKYYYLTKWTEKSTVYGKWELVVWPWRWERWGNWKKKIKIWNHEFALAWNLESFWFKNDFALSITTWQSGQRNLLSMETENLWFDLGGEKIEKKKIKIWNHEFALAWNLESFWFKMISL